MRGFWRLIGRNLAGLTWLFGSAVKVAASALRALGYQKPSQKLKLLTSCNDACLPQVCQLHSHRTARSTYEFQAYLRSYTMTMGASELANRNPER